MIATSEMGQLQTVFYIVLVGGTIIAMALFLVGVGFGTLPAFYRRQEHRLLAALIGGALVFTLAFILATSGLLVYSVSRRG
ncbi:MAG: hypothetical protein M3010_08275 [Candidatus Dormibacteraeota bacterium]|nr:hypothetical protein [Candidatus Dormibacteraeota bacterium]